MPSRAEYHREWRAKQSDEYKRRRLERQRERRAEQRAANPYWVDGRSAKNPPPITHGTTTGYRRGCRCVECAESVNIYQRVLHGGTAPKNPGAYNVKRSRRAKQ